MKKLLLALFFVASTASAQYTHFAHHSTSSAGHANGLPAATFVGPYSGTPVLGDMIVFDGTNWISVPKGTNTQVLTENTNGIPTWQAAGGGGGAPTTATYITQTPDGTLSAEQALSLSATGFMKSATTTGVITTQPTIALSDHSTQAAYTFVANGTSGSAAPTALTVPLTGRVLGLPSLASATTFDVWDELDKGYVNNSTAYGGSTLMGNSVVSGTAMSIVPSNGVQTNFHTWIDGNHPGVPECGGGTATADTCWFLQGVGTGTVSGQFVWTAGLAVEILFHGDTVSDGTDTYTVFLGSTSTAVTTSIGVTNSVYASYTHSANSGNFVMNTCKATTCTTGNTATAYPGSAWQHFLMYVDAAGTGLHFSFGCTTPENPTACADATNSPIATTNLPTVAQQLAFGIVKTAGTNPRSLALDYVHVYMIPGSNLAR